MKDVFGRELKVGDKVATMRTSVNSDILHPGVITTMRLDCYGKWEATIKNGTGFSWKATTDCIVKKVDKKELTLKQFLKKAAPNSWVDFRWNRFRPASPEEWLKILPKKVLNDTTLSWYLEDRVHFLNTSYSAVVYVTMKTSVSLEVVHKVEGRLKNL